MNVIRALVVLSTAWLCQADLIQHNIAHYLISIENGAKVPTIRVTHANSGKIAWQTIHVDGAPFLRLGNGTVSQPPIVDGNFQVHETTTYLSDAVTIDDTSVDNNGLTITGQLLDSSKLDSEQVLVADYTITFQLYDPENNISDTKKKEINRSLKFDIFLTPAEHLRHYRKYTSDSKGIKARNDTHGESIEGALDPRIFLDYWCEPGENFYGFGESFTYFNLNGLRVPIVVSEQGVGRGEQPITDALNFATEGSGGYWYTTYAPKPVYVTNFNRSIFFDGSAVMYVDLTQANSTGVIELEAWALSLGGFIPAQQDSLLDAVEAITAITGRQDPVPEWTQRGAVVGLEGGTEFVSEIVDNLTAAGVPMAGVWLQDWVGLQSVPEGDRLIWNWEVNYDYYPGWGDMVAKWHSQDTRVLTYISPFFSDPTGYVDASEIRHNFFQEGVDNGYFVQQRDAETGELSTYLLFSISIKFAMVDLTNPAARRWMKDVIINQSIMEAQSSGWMCDFGEYLPFDAVLYNGESAAEYHNRYPEEWGTLTAEAVAEAKERLQQQKQKEPEQRQGQSALNETDTLTDGDSDTAIATDTMDGAGVRLVPVKNTYEPEVMYFMRSAWTRSPKTAPIFWLGDQLVSWDSNDGLRSTVTGALSSGLTGHAITHSDIGGYTVEENLGAPQLTYVRSPELLKRWSEQEAFGFGLFRTHIGSSTTDKNAQVYDSPESMAHFAKFASIFAHLHPYRAALMREAQSSGHPLIRPLAAYFGYDAAVWDVVEQYMFGADFMVAPCMYEGAEEVEVYFPQYSGPWIHIWSGDEISPPDGEGITFTGPAPIGQPPVFYKKGSLYGQRLEAFLTKQGYIEDYEWSYSA